MRKISRNQRATISSAIIGLALSLFAGVSVPINAEQVHGDAPFINTWLVSGPFKKPVADNILKSNHPIRPVDENWAGLATATASSSWQTGPLGFPANSPEGKHLPANAIDGNKATMWLSQTHNTEGNPSTWPKWDPAPTLTLNWQSAITVKRICLYGRAINYKTKKDVTCVLLDKQGKPLASKVVTIANHDGTDAFIVDFDQAVKEVSTVEIKIENDMEKALHNVGLGLMEVEVFDYDKPMNIAQKAKASVNSEYSKHHVAKNAIDGNKGTEWASKGSDEKNPRALTLEWQSPVKVKRIEAFDRNASGADLSKKVTCTIYSSTDECLQTVTIENPYFSEAGVYQFEKPLENVSKMVLTLSGGPGNAGLSEVNVFEDYPKESVEVELPVPTGHVTAKLGEKLTFESESNAWEYFDDRIFNRNYDDYQDLNGYYAFKKGIDTKNKYVYAQSCVYSPIQQKVSFSVGASGSFTLFVNDIPVTLPSKPAEVKKDMVKVPVILKQGWNKLLIQIQHTYTEDLNENGVPIAKDHHVSFIGFYGRIAKLNGNKIDGLVYSIAGDAEKLAIVTQGLSSDDLAKNKELPKNVMPTAYTQWPYIWNKSNGNKQHGVAASHFRFMAQGGTPDYTWTIAKGKLPNGLTLNADGTIDGIIDCDPGCYEFTLQVKDKKNDTAEKAFSIEVKLRPTVWFEEGRISALSHTGPIYQWFLDDNFSADVWAQRARRQGHSMVSVESLQQNYYWPSKFADPKHPRNVYMKMDKEGKISDGLKQFEDAVKRHGMQFGLYYATEGGGLGHYSTDVFVQNVSDLIERYQPVYLYFDGPQRMPWSNFDVQFSNVRNYSNDIIINSNSNGGWGGEFGDADLRTTESCAIYAGARTNVKDFVKMTPYEPWKSLHTKNNHTPYYAKRDDYRQVVKEIILNAGRGLVDNNDQMPIMSRGTNWDSPENVAMRYPKSFQEYVDVREGTASWFVPVGKPERHESTTGTYPYFLAGNGFEDDGKGNYQNFESGKGPKWGYATHRDQNIYLHIMDGPDGKTGFKAISDPSTLVISPVKHKVESVWWFNENIAIPFTQTGETLTLNLTGVKADDIDTIIKIVTNNPQRKFKLTNVVVTGEQLTDATLRLNAEGYMTFPALKAPLSDVVYDVKDNTIVSVDATGVVRALANGTTTVTVKGTYENVTKNDTIKLTVKAGKVYVGEKLIGATLNIDTRESFGEFDSGSAFDYKIEGRSEKGGAIGLVGATITWHGGFVDLKAGDKFKPVVIREVTTFTFADGKVKTPHVTAQTRGVVWADVELDGQKFTTNRVYMDIMPYQNLSLGAKISASGSEKQTVYLNDRRLIEGLNFDKFKWSVPGNGPSWVQFELSKRSMIDNVAINFNMLNQHFFNTPKTIKIEISDNGTQWESVATVNGPKGGAFFGFANTFEIKKGAKFVKLSFEQGSNGETLDLLEVAINGTP